LLRGEATAVQQKPPQQDQPARAGAWSGKVANRFSEKI